MQLFYTMTFNSYIAIEERLVKLVIQFMIAGTQIIYKLQVYIKFFFTNYRHNGIEAHQKIQKYSSIRLL